MTGTDVARFTHKQSRSYLNHLVISFTWHITLIPSSKILPVSYQWIFSYHIRRCIKFAVQAEPKLFTIKHTQIHCSNTGSLQHKQCLMQWTPDTSKRIHFVRIRTKNRLTAQRCGRSEYSASQAKRLALFIRLSAQAARSGFHFT